MPNGEALREPTRTITVRLPRSEHIAIRREAYAARVSMNTLARCKLAREVPADELPPPAWDAIDEEGESGG